MRVVHVISSIDPRKGGPVLALEGLTRAQRKLGIDVSIVATFAAGNPANADVFHQDDIPVTLIGPTWGKLGFSSGMEKALRSAVGAADIVHIHAIWEQVQHRAARQALALGKPYILRPCGMLDPWSLAQHRWMKRLVWMLRVRFDATHATALHATSEMEADNLRQLLLNVPVIVEPNGVRLSEFESLPPPGWLAQRVPALNNRRAILFLGRIHVHKGLDLLVPAFAEISRDFPDVDLVIAGPNNDGYLPQVQQMIRERGLTERVYLLGMLRGLERVAALHDAELFVLPSGHENFGISVVEAMAAETPVIVSNEVALHAEVTRSGAGEAVPRDVGPLADAMRRWLNNPTGSIEAGRRGRRTVMQRYAWDRIAGRWRDRYQRILSSVEATSDPVLDVQ